MARKATHAKGQPEPTPPDPKPEAPTPTPTPKHPTLMLYYALIGLKAACQNADHFRDLARRREEAWDFRMNLLNAFGAASSRRANTLARAGRPFSEVLSEATEDGELLEAALAPPGSNVPAEWIQCLRNMLDIGDGGIAKAREALRAGGAKGWDAATQPNAAGQTRSIELHTKLQDAGRVFTGLRAGIVVPSILIGDDAERMERLGGYFAHAYDELHAVIEMNGLEASVRASAPHAVGRAANEDDGEYWPATSFKKGMADRLRQAASKTRKTKRVSTRMVDGVVCYSVADARRWWPNDVPIAREKP